MRHCRLSRKGSSSIVPQAGFTALLASYNRGLRQPSCRRHRWTAGDYDGERPGGA